MVQHVQAEANLSTCSRVVSGRPLLHRLSTIPTEPSSCDTPRGVLSYVWQRTEEKSYYYEFTSSEKEKSNDWQVARFSMKSKTTKQNKNNLNRRLRCVQPESCRGSLLFQYEAYFFSTTDSSAVRSPRVSGVLHPAYSRWTIPPDMSAQLYIFYSGVLSEPL